MMLSNIKYLPDKDINQKKELKELLLNKIKEIEEKNNTHILRPLPLYELLLYSKYIIEKENLDYKTIIEGNLDELTTILNERFQLFKNYHLTLTYVINNIELNTLLKEIIFKDYEISTYIDRVFDNYIDSNKKYLLISTHDIDHIKYPNIDIYLDIHPRKIESKKIIDEITGINRTYYKSLSDIDIKQYDEIIYINDGREYKNIYDNITTPLKAINNIFMICKYADISRYRDDILCIDEILLDKERTYILYKSKNHNRLLNHMLIKEISNIEDNKIKDMINNKEEIKDICIHITEEDFRKHNYRIGINVYKTEIYKNENNKKQYTNKTKIIKLIDYNRSMENRLRELDNIISKQIDEMIVR